MTVSRGQRLMQAVLAAQGAPLDPGLSPEDVAHADLLLEARRRDHERGAIPRPARRRAHALLARLPERPWALLARLVFDSWADLAPAARSLGSERLFRFENTSAALDVQVGREPADEGATVAVAVEGGGEDREVRLVVDGGERPLQLTLDAHGTGSTRLAASVREVVVLVGDEDGELLRTPPVALR